MDTNGENASYNRRSDGHCLVAEHPADSIHLNDSDSWSKFNKATVLGGPQTQLNLCPYSLFVEISVPQQY